MRSYFPVFSAKIRLEDNIIHYTIENKSIAFPVDGIRMIGEFSAPPGTFAADYFFTFKLKGNDTLLDIPAYTDGIFDLLAQLRSECEGLEHPKLQMSTDFNSNILYPAELAGKSLYEFRQESRPLINAPVLKRIVVVEKVVKIPNPLLA